MKNFQISIPSLIQTFLNMINYKSLTIEDLKKDYSDRFGFIFASNVRSSDTAIENLCQTLITHNITDTLPEFVSRDSGNTIVFVYPEDCTFKSGEFYHKSQMLRQMGIAQVDTLAGFLKDF